MSAFLDVRSIGEAHTMVRWMIVAPRFSWHAWLSLVQESVICSRPHQMLPPVMFDSIEHRVSAGRAQGDGQTRGAALPSIATR